MSRTALLIRCAVSEADKIRARAQQQQNSISTYVLRVVLRAVEVEEQLSSTPTPYSSAAHLITRSATGEPGPRTAILVRCDIVHAERIREAARRRGVPINALVLQSLKKSWDVQMIPPQVDSKNVPPAWASPATA
jgi:predicted HicB family RNase H-like nuclease